MSKNKKKLLSSPTAIVEKFEPRFNPLVESYKYPNKELVPLNSLFCTYHPVTFIGNCLQCEMKCNFLESIIGPELTDIISIEDRNKLLEYYYGPDTPNIEIAEKYGITLRIQLLRDNPMYAPKNFQYLKIKKDDGTLVQPTYEQFKKHLRTFYQGYWMWKAAGVLGQASILIQSLPQEMKQYIDYYVHHRNCMESKNKKTVLLDVEFIDKELPSKQVEMEFKDEKSAVQYFLRNAIRALRSEKKYSEQEAKEYIMDIILQRDEEKEESDN